ncbi:hypothetical protein V6N11_059599 [Hibiscus sabdariffa]|uniref:Uncharacterized protein n=1 Tax=Hibiscus sabdariffa TaxID=183260 RepID=A0ABR2NPG8_9ROSI
MATLEGALLTYLNQAAAGLIVAEDAAWTFPDLANLGSTYTAASLKAPFMSQLRPPRKKWCKRAYPPPWHLWVILLYLSPFLVDPKEAYSLVKDSSRLLAWCSLCLSLMVASTNELAKQMEGLQFTD